MKITYNDLASFIPALRQHIPRTLLNAGCGTAGRERLPECFQGPDWTEIRLDIDPQVRPDILGQVTRMELIDDASMDAVWSSHNLEHLESHEVPRALAEIRRILKPEGFVMITLPDLEQIAQLVTEAKLEQILYQSPAGPITPLDMLFGHQASLAKGNKYMAHRTGFTADRLGNCLVEAGFIEVRILHGKSFNLWAIAKMVL